MELYATIGTLILETVGVVIPVLVWVKKIADGEKCQLRNDMLHIYYKNKDTKKIHQYEYESYVLMYEAYKALKGNSFIDKIYKEVQTWEIIM